MSRRGSIADQLEALRRFATTPDHDPEPIQTNWSVTPANDNNPEDTAELKHDRKRIVTPSVAEIMRNVRLDDVELNEAGQTIRIGRLRFSDGTQTEKAHKLTIDGKIEEYSARMPTGAMLGSRDKVDVALGGEENPQETTESNRYFAEFLKVKQTPYVTGKRFKGQRVNLTHIQAKAELADAYANTDMSKVTYTKYPTGLPSGSKKIADSFIGMQKTTCNGGGSVMWQDIVTSMAERKEWFDALDSLQERDRKALDATRTAKTYADVGTAVGQSWSYASKKGGGRKALVAANDNLNAAIKKYVA